MWNLNTEVNFNYEVLFNTFSFIVCALFLVFLPAAGKLHLLRLKGNDLTYDAAAFNYVYVEAIKQKLMGNGGDALKYLEQCIKINPESDAAYYQMAQIVIANGDIKNGKNYVTEALKIDQSNIWYLIMLAGLYYQEKNIDSAIIYYEKAVKYFPEKENLELTLWEIFTLKIKILKRQILYLIPLIRNMVLMRDLQYLL